jgi:transposase
MPRNHGYCLKGERCFGTHDWGAKGRTNVIGAMLNKQFLTVGLFESNIDTQTFTIWVKQELLPVLPPKSLIIMDNATFHKGKLMQAFIESGGHILEYLPPYSPDLNPIEKKWAQAKLLRKKHHCSIDHLFNHFNL